MSWICDQCYSEMEVTHEGYNRNKVECPSCGTYWYIDDNDEYINDGSGWNAFGDDDDSGESLSVEEAAAIWASHGKDEDYMFGYDEDELEDALS